MGGYAQQLEQRGEQRGAYSKAIVVAEKMMSKNIDIGTIAEFTDLPESKILELKSSNLG